jgi:GNAT superfamily N-acetyltransferase
MSEIERDELQMSSTPSTGELISLGAPIILRDGSRVRVRQGHSSDKELLLRGFERLSPESRYRRFLAPMPELTEEIVRYLTEIDHRDHGAMIALDEAGDGIGVTRYVRDPHRPEVAEVAEVAVTVIDDWQGRGLGTLLLEVISARAREQGSSTLTRSGSPIASSAASRSRYQSPTSAWRRRSRRCFRSRPATTRRWRS